MATDIKLDEVNGSWVVVEGRVLKTTASEFMLDAPDRRRPGGGPLRRALVHDEADGLTVNINGDYPGGVTVAGAMKVAGSLTVVGPTKVAGNLVVTGTIETASGLLSPADPGIARVLDSVQRRVDELERLLEALTDAVGVAVIPAWSTMEEVENGDDLGIRSRSAAELGLVVDFRFDQNNPSFSHGDVISISPVPGTIVPKGSTVVVDVNLEG